MVLFSEKRGHGTPRTREGGARARGFLCLARAKCRRFAGEATPTPQGGVKTVTNRHYSRLELKQIRASVEAEWFSESQQALVLDLLEQLLDSEDNLVAIVAAEDDDGLQ